MVSISEVDFNKLKQILPKDGLPNAGGTIHHFYCENKHMILKKYYDGCDNKNVFHTVDLLMKNNIPIEELVMPKDLLYIDSIKKGYSMDYIDGRTLNDILNDFKIDELMKRNSLKNIGIILDKMEKYRNDTGIDFYLGDVHESNFIVENNTNTIKVIDLDSCKYMDNKASQSKYLFLSSVIWKYEDKYPSLKYMVDIYIPSKNTDLFCYQIMLLNYISKTNMASIDEYEYYKYLEYLKEIGINKDLLDAFNGLYSEYDNTNPYELIDTLPNELGKASYKVFKYLKKTIAII